MKVNRILKYCFVFLLIHKLELVFAQKNEDWYKFYDSKSNLFGYKDENGNIKIKPKFTERTVAKVFKNIIAVEEMEANKKIEYYLFKNGTKRGIDSVNSVGASEFFIGTYVYESEEKISFKDKKTGKIGFFNKKGEVIIPAIFYYASVFRNGIASVMTARQKQCIDYNLDTANCKNYEFIGSKPCLINDKNEIIVQGSRYGTIDIDFYSVKINVPNIDSTIYITYKGISNNKFSFIDYNKEFTNFFYKTFLNKVKSKTSKINTFIFEEVSYKNDDETKNLSKNQFTKFYTKESLVFDLDSSKFNISIQVQADATFFSTENPKFKPYLNACGDLDYEQFPIYQIWINSKPDKNNITTRNTTSMFLEFLRTKNGYKLIGISAQMF
jgi:WG containing repeat